MNTTKHIDQLEQLANHPTIKQYCGKLGSIDVKKHYIGYNILFFFDRNETNNFGFWIVDSSFNLWRIDRMHLTPYPNDSKKEIYSVSPLQAIHENILSGFISSELQVIAIISDAQCDKNAAIHPTTKFDELFLDKTQEQINEILPKPLENLSVSIEAVPAVNNTSTQSNTDNDVIDCRSELGLIIGNIDALISLNRLAIKLYSKNAKDDRIHTLFEAITVLNNHVYEKQVAFQNNTHVDGALADYANEPLIIDLLGEK